MVIQTAATTTGSRLFAETMKAYDVSHIFFVPAITTRALAEMEDLDIRRVSTHSELSAAFMADGYARAARKPGVCLAQAVGAANLAAGLKDAYLAGSAVIAITGGPHPDSRYRHLYQQIEDLPMFGPVTKFNARVEKVERLPDLLRQAFRAATSGAPGPVHLEIPGRSGEEILREAALELIVEERFRQYPAYRTEPDPESVQEAARLLSAAERPIIVAGGGVTASNAATELVKLAEKLSIPVVTSLNGKETISASHPLALGLVGYYGRSCANQAVAESDLVFFVGSQAGGMVTDDWKAPRPGTPVIQLDIDPEEIGRNYPVKVGLLGDAKLGLQRLIEAAVPEAPRADWLQHVRELLRTWQAKTAAMTDSDSLPINPARICQEISAWLPANAVVVSDTGHAAIWTGSMLNLTRPGQRYIRCAGTLGWGFPGAMGVKCALPDQTVVCFTGDGGFYYHLSELETAARLGINLVVVVNNNGSLSQTKRGWDRAYDGNQRGRAHEMWVYHDTNLAAAAEALGCLGIRVTEPGQIRGALQQAAAANRPVVIDVISSLEARPLGPWD